MEHQYSLKNLLGLCGQKLYPRALHVRCSKDIYLLIKEVPLLLMIIKNRHMIEDLAALGWSNRPSYNILDRRFNFQGDIMNL